MNIFFFFLINFMNCVIPTRCLLTMCTLFKGGKFRGFRGFRGQSRKLIPAKPLTLPIREI